MYVCTYMNVDMYRCRSVFEKENVKAVEQREYIPWLWNKAL